MSSVSAACAAGMNVKVRFKMVREDSAQIVDSTDGKEPLEFVCGEGLVPKCLDQAVIGMTVGETRELTLTGDEAFGAREAKELEVPLEQLPPEASKVGALLKITGPDGEDVWATVTSLASGRAVLDLNHPLAGVPISLSVTLLACEEAPALSPFEVETTSPGDGKTYPSQGDLVAVHYSGMVVGGASFASTRAKGPPVEFRVGMGQVMRGLDEALPLMSLGERANIRVPAVMAYGAEGQPNAGIPPGADLIFDLELLKISSPTSIADVANGA